MRCGECILATTDLAVDDALAAAAACEGITVYRGAEDDVVARFVGAANQFGFDVVGRVTGDCPFVDAELVDWCVGQSADFDRHDLATTKGKFPVGLDVELYPADRMAALDRGTALSLEEREHLTLHFYNNPASFEVRTIATPAGWKPSSRSFTVDTAADYAAAVQIVDGFGRSDFSIQSLLEAHGEFSGLEHSIPAQAGANLLGSLEDTQ